MIQMMSEWEWWSTDGWMDEMDGWINGWMDKWMGEMDGTDGWMKWMDEMWWMKCDGWNGWMGGRGFKRSCVLLFSSLLFSSLPLLACKVIEAAGRWEHEECDVNLAQYRQLVRLLDEAIPTLGVGHLSIRGVLDLPDLQLHSPHHTDMFFWIYDTNESLADTSLAIRFGLDSRFHT